MQREFKMASDCSGCCCSSWLNGPKELGADCMAGACSGCCCLSWIKGFPAHWERIVPLSNSSKLSGPSELRADSTSFEHPAREERVLKRHGVGDGEGDLGAEFSSCCAAKIAHDGRL
jgi:hypothetical protein